MSELGMREKLAIELTNSRREAISLGDDLLVYLLNMAILHIRRRNSAERETAAQSLAASDSLSLRSAPGYYLPNGPTEKILLSLLAPLSQLSNIVDGGGAKVRIADSHEGA